MDAKGFDARLTAWSADIPAGPQVSLPHLRARTLLRRFVQLATLLLFTVPLISADSSRPPRFDAVFFGDSVTVGVGASSLDNGFSAIVTTRLEPYGLEHPPQQVISAFGGIYTDLVDAPQVTEDGASLIIVEVGAHSVMENHAMTFATYRRGYGLLLDCLQASGATVVVGTVPSLNWQEDDPNYARADTISDIIRSEAGARGIVVADIWNATRGRNDLVSGDELHPNDAGHRVIAETYWASIAPLLGHPHASSPQTCGYSNEDLVRVLR